MLKESNKEGMFKCSKLSKHLTLKKKSMREGISGFEIYKLTEE